MTNHYLYDYKRTALNKFLEDIRSGFQTPYVRKTPRKHLKKLLKLLDNDSLWTNKLSDKQMTIFYDINEKINKYLDNYKTDITLELRTEVISFIDQIDDFIKRNIQLSLLMKLSLGRIDTINYIIKKIIPSESQYSVMYSEKIINICIDREELVTTIKSEIYNFIQECGLELGEICVDYSEDGSFLKNIRY